MSNALAVAAVTATLRHLIEESLAGDQPAPVGDAVVTTLRPEQLARQGQLDSMRGINIYLYGVTPNHAIDLTDLPTRDGDGRLTRTPKAAFDLHYLISCHGADAALEPQRLLARAILALSVTPVLTQPVVEAMIRRFADDPDLGFLDATDLKQQEVVKLAPITLSLEELSRLWGVLGTPYLLSVTYAATVVVLEPHLVPRPVLLVRHPVVAAGPLQPSRLRGVAPEVTGPVESGSRLVLDGIRLLGGRGDVTTQIRIGPARLTPEPDSTDDRVTVLLGDEVPAGVHAVQAVQQRTAGPGGPRVVGRSDALPVVVRPRVTVTVPDTDPATVHVTVAPPVRPGQDAVVILDRLDEGVPHALQFPLPRGDTAQTQVDLRRQDVPDGRWRVQIRVDGVDSVPTLIEDTYLGPELVLP